MDFSTIDITIFALYAVLILSIGLYVSRQKKGETKSAEDYFLAGKSLPWWVRMMGVWPSFLPNILPKTLAKIRLARVKSVI